MKIIFLDIDGVLNNTVHAIKMNQEYEELAKAGKLDPYVVLDRDAVRWLNKLIFDTGAKVVITSTWRFGRTVEELYNILRKAGFEGEVIGKTPNLHSVEGSILRGNEILKWIMDNKNLVGEYYSFNNYVIFDDDSDMLYWQRNNFIHIDGYFGLSPNHCYRAEKILNRNFDNKEQL